MDECKNIALHYADKCGKLQAENKKLREALENNKANSYPGLAVKEGTLLNQIYKNSTKALKQ